MTNALVTQLLEALLASSVNEDNLAQTTEAITAAREYLATEPSGERAELIAKLRTGGTVMEESEIERLDDLCKKAADMMDAARLALDALYAYEPCIKKFGLLFGTGNKAIAALKAVL